MLVVLHNVQVFLKLNITGSRVHTEKSHVFLFIIYISEHCFCAAAKSVWQCSSHGLGWIWVETLLEYSFYPIWWCIYISSILVTRPGSISRSIMTLSGVVLQMDIICGEKEFFENYGRCPVLFIFPAPAWSCSRVVWCDVFLIRCGKLPKLIWFIKGNNQCFNTSRLSCSLCWYIMLWIIDLAWHTATEATECWFRCFLGEIVIIKHFWVVYFMPHVPAIE